VRCFNQSVFASANTLALQKGGENKMTKRNLLLVTLFVVWGIVAMAPSALAQTTWTVAAPVALVSGRAEGKAEATAPVTIAIQTGGFVSANSYFTITYSVPITNTGTLDVTCGSTASPAAGPWASGACVNLSAPTVSGNTLTIQFSAVTTFTTGDGSYLSVTVRVDASRVTPLPGQVTAAVTATPAVGYTISVSPTTAQQVLAVNAKPSLSLQYDPYKDTLVDKGTPADVLTCIGVKAGTPNAEFIINIAENFSYALTTQAQEMIWAPGKGFNEASPSDVTNGSNLVFTFSNVPATVGIQAKDIEPCSTLSTADPLYCAGGSLGLSLTSSNTVAAPTAAGQASFTYTVTSLDARFAENVTLTFLFWSNGPLSPGLPPMTVNVAYAPILSTLPAAVPDPQPIPYFTGGAEAAIPLPVVNFGDCVTYLLFPYVNAFTAGGTFAFSNFGTGIALANTTTDPFGSNPATAAGSAVPQTGSCTLYLYPNDLTGPYTITTPTIASGGTAIFDVATATVAGYTSAPAAFKNKQGYAIAICNFQDAYGYWEIYDNYGLAGSPTAVLGGFAYILPNPAFYPRSGAGDAPGESAIAPAITNKLMQKLLHDLSRK
jgi:hypothetical protein